MESGTSELPIRENILKYLHESQTTEAERMDLDSPRSGNTIRRLEGVLDSLKAQLKDLTEQLDRVRTLCC